MKVKKMHYAGGIVYSNGNRLPGWPCCCTGDQALKITNDGRRTYFIDEVTCKKCLKMIEQQENYRLKYPDIWKESKKKGYTTEPIKGNPPIKLKKIY